MATTLPNTGAIIPATGEKPDQAVNNAAFTAIDAALFGRLAESGSNANGRYVKFADGTMICSASVLANLACTTPIFGGFESPQQTWTFPAAFIEPPSSVSISPAMGGSRRYLGVNRGRYSGYVYYGVISSASITTDVETGLLAIGRWK